MLMVMVCTFSPRFCFGSDVGVCLFFAHLLLISENTPSARRLENKNLLAHFHLWLVNESYSRYYASFNLYLCFSLSSSLSLSFPLAQSSVRSFFHFKLKSFRTTNKGTHTYIKLYFMKNNANHRMVNGKKKHLPTRTTKR